MRRAQHDAHTRTVNPCSMLMTGFSIGRIQHHNSKYTTVHYTPGVPRGSDAKTLTGLCTPTPVATTPWHPGAYMSGGFLRPSHSPISSQQDHQEPSDSATPPKDYTTKHEAQRLPLPSHDRRRLLPRPGLRPKLPAGERRRRRDVLHQWSSVLRHGSHARR